MASPVAASRVNTLCSSDPWTVTLVNGIVAGDLLIVIGRTGTGATFNLPTGWTWLLNNDTSDASNDTVAVIYKWATGSEGTSLSWDLSGADNGCTIMWRITGAENPATQAPEIASATYIGNTADVADPPSISPTGGSKDYLFIAVGSHPGENTNVFSAGPAGYSSFQAANSGTVGSTGDNCCMGSAARQATTATENPGLFTHAASFGGGGLASTIAVHPPGGGGGSTFVPRVVSVT